ncbi:class I SAM-dependent DNA methyltransferase [Microbacterium sp. NPDC058342]|uniref:HsdM family class I SAM-dependent methyltransferase n=1 Tax=Microbacterium sp. NPDC058342 TaxID=3346454 RepID=UPI00364AA3AF
MTTSPSLAKALAVGCLAGLDQSLKKIDIWDPAVGSGYAGGMLADALTAAGINVRYRGQDINERAVMAARDRLASVPDAEVVHTDTLGEDRFATFTADLVIVDAPWGLDWKASGPAVHARHDRGEFRFGLPQGSDSAWLFISLALEKLRPASQGGGRVAALVAPRALSSGGSTEELRRAIMAAGLIESVTRLPEGLAPNTAIPLYLLTFTNTTGRVTRDTAMIADLRAQFTTDKRRRSILRSAFDELESGLRRWKPGPRSRVIRTSQFIRRDATLGRTTSEGRKLSWRLTSFNDTPVDSDLLESRYGPESGIAVDGSPRETVDLDPSHHFSDDAGDILKSLAATGWSARRLTTLLASEPTQSDGTEESNASIFVPTTRVGVVSTASAGTNSEGRVLRVPLDEVSIDTGFLAAWLNSEVGESSRRRRSTPEVLALLCELSDRIRAH